MTGLPGPAGVLSKEEQGDAVLPQEWKVVLS